MDDSRCSSARSQHDSKELVAAFDNLKEFKRLLLNGAEFTTPINVRLVFYSSKKYSLLMNYVQEGCTPLLNAASQGKLICLALLLLAGADIEDASAV